MKCRFGHVALFTSGNRLSPRSCSAAALVRCAFADTALEVAGAATLLAGGAFAGGGTGAGSTSRAGAFGTHFDQM